MDDDVEAAPIYRGDVKAGQPIIRPCENHDLHMKQESTWTESCQKQQALSKAVLKSGSLDTNTQNPGNAMSTHHFLLDLGLDQLQHPLRKGQMCN